jgi:hypothetical protein
VWPLREPPRFARPWVEVALALLAVAGVIGVGQLYSRGWLLPSGGALGGVAEAANQLAIFSPMLLLLALRRQPLSTAWLPRERLGARLAIGLVLAVAALVAFALTRSGCDLPWLVVGRVFAARNAPIAVQVLLEDVSIAIVLVRLGAATRRPRLSAVGVAALFAAAHLPAMLSGGGVGVADVASLSLDFALAAGALLVVQRSSDVAWFWLVHTAMDLTQFSRITGVA